MKYIGNKTRVLDFIERSLMESKINIDNIKVADLFAGTGSVSNFFLKHDCDVYSCDNMTYSIAEQYRTNFFTCEPEFEELQAEVGTSSLEGVLKYLNELSGERGYFFENYAPGGQYQRQYFSDENAKRIDAIRKKIEEWQDRLSYEKYMYLTGILMCAADKISNTSGTYGAYLKIWRSMALKSLELEKPEVITGGHLTINQQDVLDFLRNNKGFDLIYLDPPYNERQYASNFHVLESITVYDKQSLKGKTGLREYENQKSKFCNKRQVLSELSQLFELCDTKYIAMSYSTEGLLQEKDIYDELCKYGRTEVYRMSYRRFKTNGWTDDDTSLKELLFVCTLND